MALDELRRNIEQEAKSAASKLEKDSDSEAEAILAKARNEANELKKRSKDEAMSEAEQRKKDMLTAIDMETSAILSVAKEGSIDSELRHFEVIIRKKLQSRQGDIIKSALKRFFDVVPQENSIAKVSKKNAPLMKSYKAKVEQTNVDGIILSSIDKRVTADASIDGLVESNAETIRRSLSKGMFG